MTRIFLCGPGGTGKTTLANLLTDNLSLKSFFRIREVARRILEEKNIDPAELHDQDFFLKFQEMILLEQSKKEAEAEVYQNYISDRSILDPLTYYYLTTVDQHGNRKLLEFIAKNQSVVTESVKRYKQSLVIIVPPFSKDNPENDGVRLLIGGQTRDLFLELFREVLDMFQINYTVLCTTGKAERMKELTEILLREEERTRLHQAV